MEGAHAMVTAMHRTIGRMGVMVRTRCVVEHAGPQ
jgi:hypothetical protein